MEPPIKLRDFFDPLALNDQIHKNVISSYHKKLSEIETPDFKLQIKDLHLEHKKFSFLEQKKAILEKRDITIPLKATVDLFDKRSGNVTESKKVTIANIPVVTERNTVVYNGSEYESIHQQRLLPGIYSRIRQSGEAEAHINPEARTGVSGRILFLPDKQLFVLMLQSTQIKLYGILKALGVSDSDMLRSWGDDIFNANRQVYTGDEIDKLYSKLYMD